MSDEHISPKVLAAMIDHAILAPNTTENDLHNGCQLAATAGVASICVRPCDVKEAKGILSGAGIVVGTVIGYPHGGETPPAKAFQARQAIDDGADELDMVINIGRLISGRTEVITDEIAQVVQAAKGRLVKVILECCYLNQEQMAVGCGAAVSAGAGFVKTSTGFGPGGATAEDVRFLRSQVAQSIGVKASGGVRTLADAKAMIQAGANRLGTSSTERILAELCD